MDYIIPMRLIDQTAKIKELTAQLAERDAEIERLKDCYRMVVDNLAYAQSKQQELAVENAALREEVESLKEVQGICEVCEVEAIKHADKARKRTAQEIVDMLRSDRWAESELRGIVNKFGLEW